MAEKKKRKRLRKLLGLAAIGALVTWIVQRKKGESPEAEGTWRDFTPPEEEQA